MVGFATRQFGFIAVGIDGAYQNLSELQPDYVRRVYHWLIDGFNSVQIDINELVVG